MNHSDIVNKIPERFDNALKAGDLVYFPSTTTRHVESNIEFEIRLCPALQHKPAVSSSLNAADAAFDSGKVSDPFAPPYNPNLYVGEMKDDESQEEFVVLLNKYSVIPHHFLMVTKEFRPQSSPLMPSELLHAYLLLLSQRRSGRKFFSFYNCGNDSGASQAHKHIQFVPFDGEGGPPIERLARQAQLEFTDRPFSLKELSYASHIFRFPPDMGTLSIDHLEAILSSAFIQLLDLSISTIRHDPEYPTGSPSYNVILTLEHLHLIPRKHETYTLPETGDKININSMGFAGMLLVRDEGALEAVKREGVTTILRGVALQSVHDLQVEGTAREP